MRRWYVPLTIMGVGGLGALLLSERGRAVLQKLMEKIWQAPDRLLDWNDNLQDELDHIQMALDQIAESLDLHPELGQ